MSATAFAQIAAALGDLCTTAPAAAPLVRVNPVRPAEREVALCIDVRQGDTQQQATHGTCSREWRTSYELEISGRGVALGNSAAAIDTALGVVFARVAAASLPALGVIELDAEPQAVWTFEPGDTPICQATLRLQVRHMTQYDSLQPEPITE